MFRPFAPTGPVEDVAGNCLIPVRHGGILLALWLIALGLRVALIFYFDTWHIAPATDHWSFGFEIGRVARSLAEGNGFASPFQEPTGPTAWLAPGYPWMLSFLFRWFGVFSPAAALAALLINSLLSAATCLVVYGLGRLFFDENTGLLGAAFFALSPAAIWHTITTIWDVAASALLLSVLIYGLRRLQCSPGLKPALLTGLIAGSLALFNPACLVVYAAGLTWICLRDRKRPAARLWAVLVGLPLLVCLPWMIRNELVLHRFTLKSNFGTELRIGNNPLAPATPDAAVMNLHPTNTDFARYRLLGEVRYVDWCKQQALTFIRENPSTFLKLVFRRVLVFWTGADDNVWTGNLKTGVNWAPLKRLIMAAWSLAAMLGLAAGFRYPDRFLLLLTIAAYPLPYYLTHSTNRYRMPIEPVLALLAAHSVVWLWRKWSPGRPSPNLPPAA